MDLYNYYAVLENIRAVLSKTEEFSCLVSTVVTIK